ncbi:hypothetical protein GCM10029964_049660 [Kibdelosporangium lantanae]
MDRRAIPGRFPHAELTEPVGERGDRPVPEQHAHGNVHTQAAKPVREPQCQQGVAADLEEVVLDTHVVAPEDLGEHVGDALFGGRAWVVLLGPAGLGAYRREGGDIELSVGQQRHSVQEDDRPGDQLLRQQPTCAGAEGGQDVRVGRAHVGGGRAAGEDDRGGGDVLVVGERGLHFTWFHAYALDLGQVPAEDLHGAVGA